MRILFITPLAFAAQFYQPPTPELTWQPSQAQKQDPNLADEEIKQYNGRWEMVPAYNETTYEMTAMDEARHHAISKKFGKTIAMEKELVIHKSGQSTDDTGNKPKINLKDTSGQSLIYWPTVLILKPRIQFNGFTTIFNDDRCAFLNLTYRYDVTFKNGLECGGAYIKILTEGVENDGKEFSNLTPYTIMFGPDKCSGSRVHFIFNYKDPVAGVEEKHMNNPPPIKDDKDPHLYTLVVKKDQTFEILIDQVSVTTGSLLKDFTPAVNPPEEIPDESDIKPEGWIEEPRMKDPNAKKPDDWDESQPRLIADPDAKKPATWKNDAPAMILDPSAEKPEEWDDNDEWTPDMIPNPDCATGECGVWTPPMITNPLYKGIWTAPQIDNPDYKGPWRQKMKPNPDYREDKEPTKQWKVTAAAFELWTMQGGLAFDNIYVGNSYKEAQSIAEKTFKPKQAAAAALKAAEEPAEEEIDDEDEDDHYSILGYTFSFKSARRALSKFSHAFLASPLQTVKTQSTLAGVLLASIFIVIGLVLLAVTGPEELKKDAKKAATAIKKKTDAVTEDVKEKITELKHDIDEVMHANEKGEKEETVLRSRGKK